MDKQELAFSIKEMKSFLEKVRDIELQGAQIVGIIDRWQQIEQEINDEMTDTIKTLSAAYIAASDAQILMIRYISTIKDCINELEKIK